VTKIRCTRRVLGSSGDGWDDSKEAGERDRGLTMDIVQNNKNSFKSY
jgi:hypothetical protein